MGTSDPSNPSQPAVPLDAQVPGPPLIETALGRDQSVIVSWAAPGDDGGTPVTGYRLTAQANGRTKVVTATADATTATIGGLIDGTTYTVRLVALNSVGRSRAAGRAVVPSAAYAPGRPADVSATPDGSGNLEVSWSAPADNGGSALTGYTVTWQQVAPDSSGQPVPAPGSTPTSTTVEATTPSLNIPAAQLQPAAALYSVSVTASNSAGVGPAGSIASPVAPVTQVSSKTTVVDASTMAALGSDVPATSGAGHILTWPAPAPAAVQALTSGAIIVAASSSAAPQGLIDKVTDVSTDPSGTVTIDTVPAALDQVFSTLALATTVDPLSDADATGQARSGAARQQAQTPLFQPEGPGVRDLSDISPDASPTLDFSKSLSMSFHHSTGNGDLGASVDGQFSVKPDVSLSASVDSHLEFWKDSVGLTAAAKMAVNASVTAEAHIHKSWQLAEITGDPIDVQVGPVPIEIFPKLPITLSVDGQIGMRLTASATVGASMSWNSKESGHLDVTNISKPLTTSAGPLDGKTNTGQLTVDLSVQPQLDIDDLAGPNVEADAVLTANVNLQPPPGGDYLTVTPQLKLSAGLDVDIDAFNIHKSLEVTLATKTFPAFVVHAPPDGASLSITPADPTVDTGGSVDLTSARSDGATGDAVTWKLIGAAGDTVTSTGTNTAQLNAVAPAGRTITVVATDDELATGTATVFVGARFDPVSSLTAEPNPAGNSGMVTWLPPTNTGGDPIANYVVQTTGGSITHAAADTTATVSGLTLGADDIVTVYPVNSAGVVGPDSSVTLGTPPGIWTPSRAALPSDAVNYVNATLASVSCPTAVSCSAVGSYTDGDGDRAPVIDTLAAGAWNATRPDLPNDASSSNADAMLTADDCASATARGAVGTYVDSDSDSEPMFDELSGSTWTSTAVPLPSGPGGSPALASIGCTTDGTCTAVGSYNAGGVIAGLIATDDGGQVSSVMALAPSNADLSQPVELTSIACPAAGTCTAVGSYWDTTGTEQGFIDTLSDGQWNAVEAPDPVAGGHGAALSLTSISCPTTSACVAVGSLFGGPVIETLSNGRWTSDVPDLPADAATQASLRAVSCSSAMRCLAVGQYVNSDSATEGLGESLAFGQWTPQPVDAPGIGSLSASLDAVDCPNGSDCVAAGQLIDSHSARQGLLATFIGGTVTPLQAGLPGQYAGGSPGEPDADLDAVSCGGLAGCVAVGQYDIQISSYTSEGLVERLSGF